MGDLLIVDTPPLRASADVSLLAAAAGTVVLTVRGGSTNGRQIAAAVDLLEGSRAHLLGLVLARSTHRSTLGDSISSSTAVNARTTGRAPATVDRLAEESQTAGPGGEGGHNGQVGD